MKGCRICNYDLCVECSPSVRIDVQYIRVRGSAYVAELQPPTEKRCLPCLEPECEFVCWCVFVLSTELSDACCVSYIHFALLGFLQSYSCTCNILILEYVLISPSPPPPIPVPSLNAPQAHSGTRR